MRKKNVEGSGSCKRSNKKKTGKKAESSDGGNVVTLASLREKLSRGGEKKWLKGIDDLLKAESRKAAEMEHEARIAKISARKEKPSAKKPTARPFPDQFGVMALDLEGAGSERQRITIEGHRELMAAM